MDHDLLIAKLAFLPDKPAGGRNKNDSSKCGGNSNTPKRIRHGQALIGWLGRV